MSRRVGSMLACLWGCVSAPIDPPTAVEPGEPLAVVASTLLVGRYEVILAQPRHGVLAASASGLTRRAGPSAPQEDVTGFIGTAEHLALLLPQLNLVAGSAGIFALSGAIAVESPLHELLGPSSTHVDGLYGGFTSDRSPPEIWLVAAGALGLWREGRLLRFALPAPAAQHRFAAAPPADGQPGVWGAWGGTLWGLTVVDDALEAVDAEPPFAVEDLAVDATGEVWAASRGILWQRSVDGAWRSWRLPAEVVDLAAHPASGSLWIRVDSLDHPLWFHRGGVFRPVHTEVSGGVLAAGPGGELLIARDDDVVQLRPDTSIALVGPAGGGRLTAPATVAVEAPFAELVDGVAARLDDREIPVLADPWRVVVTPWGLAPGRHRIAVEVAYADGAQPKTAELELWTGEAPAPTWSDDLQPIFAARCASCHGPGQAAHPLHDASSWRDEVDYILEAVREGRMPRPPGGRLTDTEIGVIEGWRATGMLDG